MSSASYHQWLQTLDKEAESAMFFKHHIAHSSHLGILQQLTLVAHTQLYLIQLLTCVNTSYIKHSQGCEFSGNLILRGNFPKIPQNSRKISNILRSLWINGNMHIDPVQCKQLQYY